jgi:L-alanine-DL-glutamate epimerase-like enolase superfamily enzyme
MKITEVTVRRYAEEHDHAGEPAGREVLTVTVHTDAGITGMGFVSQMSSRSGSVGDLYAALLRRNLKNIVVGENPLHTEQVWRRMYAGVGRLGRSRGMIMSAMAAIDCALWDIKGKQLGVPVSDLLGGRRERIPTYANNAQHLPPDKLAAKAVEYVQKGHTALKIRGNALFVTLKEATARVVAVREAVGPDVKLMVDVNGTWDADTAIQQLKAWERYDVYWLEEPVPPEDVPGYVRVRQRAGRTYIVGGEQHAGVHEFRQLIEQGAVDIVQPDANVTGGITDWLRIYNLATAANVVVSPHALQWIHIHMAAALPNVKWIEYFMADNELFDFQVKLFKGPRIEESREEDGVFLLPPVAPGLGLELDEAEAERCLVEE